MLQVAGEQGNSGTPAIGIHLPTFPPYLQLCCLFFGVIVMNSDCECEDLHQRASHNKVSSLHIVSDATP